MLALSYVFVFLMLGFRRCEVVLRSSDAFFLKKNSQHPSRFSLALLYGFFKIWVFFIFLRFLSYHPFFFLTKKYLLASLMSENSPVRIDLDGELIPSNLYFSYHFSFVMFQDHCFL